MIFTDPPYGIFQSTLLHEERHSDTRDVARCLFYFNPRSYMRSDVDYAIGTVHYHISIHAPT